MHFGKRKGYGAYPVLALALFLAPAAVWAQSTADQQQTPQTTETQPQTQTQPQAPSQRAEVLRQAQQRVNARRKLRVQQIIQDTYTHKYEVYGGGGYLRFHPGSTLQHMNEAAWNAGFTDYLAGKLGVTADFRGYYGTPIPTSTSFRCFTQASASTRFWPGRKCGSLKNSTGR